MTSPSPASPNKGEETEGMRLPRGRPDGRPYSSLPEMTIRGRFANVGLICYYFFRFDWKGLEMETTFTAVFEKVDDWYIGYVEELPGANTQGKTLDEVRENLREAIELIVVSNRELVEKGLAGKKP